MSPTSLHYKEVKVATLRDSQIEWPRSDSIYILCSGLTDEIYAFVEDSIQYGKLLESGEEQSVTVHAENTEQQFKHLIDSNDWYLLDEQGKRYEILAPMFHPENIVVWMLKP